MAWSDENETGTHRKRDTARNPRRRRASVLAITVCVLVAAAGSPVLTQPEAAPLELTVLNDRTGQPVVGALVRVVANEKTIAAGETNLHGVFPLRSSGDVSVTIEKDMFVPLRLALDDERSGDRTGLTLRLLSYGSIAGQVARSSSSAVMLTELAGNDTPHRRFQALTDSDGRFRIYGVPPGRYVLSASGVTTLEGRRATGLVGARADSFEELEFIGGDEYENVLLDTTASGVEVGGVLDRSGLPDAATTGATLVPLYAPGAPAVWSRLVPRDGRFTIPNVLPGSYELRVTAAERGIRLVAFAATRIDVFSQDVSDVRVTFERPRTVRVSVAADASARPCTGDVRLTLRPAPEWMGRLERTAVVRVGGQTVIEELLPVPYLATGEPTDARCQLVPSTVDGSAPAFQVNVAPLGRAEARVPSNTPSAMLVVLRDVTPGRSGPIQLVVRRPGTVATFEGLRTGRYTLISADTSARSSRWYDGSSSTTFALGPAGEQSFTIHSSAAP